jgi:hypothetical protein
MNQAVEHLTKASHQAAEVLYKSQQSAASAGPAGPGAGPEGPAGGGASSNGGSGGAGQGDVVDAEFVDVDESKRPN